MEKEIHYHVKVEIEKKQLEAMEEFNSVAVFSCLDAQNFGFLDFENIKNYLLKYKREIMKEHVNSILRRLSSQPDGKITFREFSLAITPNAVSLGDDAAGHMIDMDKK
jgi:Ca2+-binding EF-hand superfamily protein